MDMKYEAKARYVEGCSTGRLLSLVPLDQFDGVVLAMFAPVPSRAFDAAFSHFFMSALLRSRASQPWLYSRSVTGRNGEEGVSVWIRSAE